MSATYPDATDEQVGVPDLQTTIPQENITPDVMTPEMRAGLFQDSGGALKAALLGNPPPQTGNGLVGPSAMDAFQQAKVAAAEREKPNDMKANLDMLTGKMTVEGMPQAMWQQMLKANQFYEQALGGYAQELARNQQELLQVRGNPLLNVLATVSGQMAQQQNMPGIVQALGRANLELNPTAQRLQQERMGIMNQMTNVAGQQTAHMAQMATVMEKARANDINQGKARDAAGKAIINRLLTGVDRYEALASFETFARQMENDPVAKAYGWDKPETYGSLYERAKEELATRIAAKDRDERRQEKLSRFNKDMKVQLMDESIPIWKKKQDYMQGLREGLIDYETAAAYRKKLADADIKSDEQLRIIPAKDMDTLEKVSEMSDFMSRLEKVAKDPVFKSYMGPWNPALILQSRWFKQLQSPEQQYVQTLFGHEFPRGVDISGAMSRGFTQAEQPIIQQLIAGQTQTPEQALATIKVIRETSIDKQAKVIKAHPTAPYEKIAYLMGDAPETWDLVNKAKEQATSVGRQVTNPTTGKTSTVGAGANTPSADNPSVSSPKKGATDSGGLHNKVTPEESAPTGTLAPNIAAMLPRDGKEYALPNGQVWKWDGSKVVYVRQAAPPKTVK